MLKAKCSSCGSSIEIPDYGKYICHNCNEMIEISYNGKIDKASGSSIPWENHNAEGRLKAYIKTLVKLFIRTGNFFSRTENNSHLEDAFIFGVMIIFFTIIINLITYNIFNYHLTFFWEDIMITLSSLISDFFSLVLVVTVLFVMSVFITLCFLGFAASLYYLGSIIEKGTGGYNTGFKIICYCLPVLIFSLIPIHYIAILAMFFLMVRISFNGFRYLYKIKKVKAIFLSITMNLLIYLIPVLTYKLLPS